MGRSFRVVGGRSKKLVGCPQFRTRFHVANTFGIPMFKTESIDDMSFEQYRILQKLTEQIYKEMGQGLGNTPSQVESSVTTGSTQMTRKRGKTVRITNG